MEMARHEQIQVSIIIVITPRRGRAIEIAIQRPLADAGKGAVGVVPIKVIGHTVLLAVVGQEKVGPAIVVVVAPRHAEEGTFDGEEIALGDWRKGSIVIVLVEAARLLPGW